MDPLVQMVINLQGVKSTTLMAHLEVHDLPENPQERIDQLVESGHLVEIEYILPATTNPMVSDRVKSFLLPAGTRIKVKGAVEGMVLTP